MTSSSFKFILNEIFEGNLRDRNQTFLIHVPNGYGFDLLIEDKLREHYGSLAHPDTMRIAPDGAGNVISIETIRNSLHFLASSPAAQTFKTFIVHQAHRLNNAAANALLKTLEEPTKSTRIILITDQPAALPVTIRSRCLKFKANADPDIAISEIRHQLGQDAPKTDAPIKKALTKVNGNPSLAMAVIVHKLTPWLDRVEEFLNTRSDIPPLPVVSGKNAAPLHILASILQTIGYLRSTSSVDTSLQAFQNIENTWSLITLSGDIGRSGIDTKTRLHILLNALKNQTS